MSRWWLCVVFGILLMSTQVTGVSVMASLAWSALTSVVMASWGLGACRFAQTLPEPHRPGTVRALREDS